MFQPRVILVIILAGILTQSAILFFALALLLAWNVFLPRLNPFDWIYSRLFSGARVVAPPPRRFAQGLAAGFSEAIGLCLFGGYNLVAWILEGLFLLALMALVFGNFCLGSHIYHRLRGTKRS